RRLGGLLGAQLGRAARAQLAPREVDDARTVALPGQQAHRPPGAQLHVVGVGGEGEDVEGFVRFAHCCSLTAFAVVRSLRSLWFARYARCGRCSFRRSNNSDRRERTTRARSARTTSERSERTTASRRRAFNPPRS